MPINAIKRDIRKHRPIDWFAIFVLISAVFVIASVLLGKIEQFYEDMDKEAARIERE